MGEVIEESVTSKGKQKEKMSKCEVIRNCLSAQ